MDQNRAPGLLNQNYKITNLGANAIGLGLAERLAPNGEITIPSVLMNSYIIGALNNGFISCVPDPRTNPGPTNDTVLFVLRNADFGVTTDQLMTKLGLFTSYVVQGAVVIWKSGAFNTACAGGVYDAASKGGNALVVAAQSYAALTGAGTAITVALANLKVNSIETATPFFSLTTANTGGTGTLRGDIFLLGLVTD